MKKEKNMSKKKTILKVLGIVFAVLLVLALAGYAYYKLEKPGHSTPTSQPQVVAPSTDQTLDSIRRGLGFLKVHQEADGNFVTGKLAPKPAFTALVVDAFIGSPDKYKIAEHPFLQKALAAIVSEQKENGGIYSPIPVMSFSSYSTAIALTALAHAHDEKYAPVIARATQFLKKDQHTAPGVSQGGFGYGDGSRPDLNNTCSILDALKEAGVPEDDPVWQNATAFINRCQNRSETNDQEWAGEDGGFIYCPVGLEKGKVGRDGRPASASYGTMSYAGLVSFLYSNVDKTDPRVQSAFKWISANYDLSENVGKKDMGLFYYYRIVAKALSRYGVRYIVTPDGISHDWAKDLSDRLQALQKPDGRWVNANSAFLEDDAVMVTAYVVRTLSICHEVMNMSAKAGE
jgi:squalene-hopene/tetraprenyl-beta-curcumene cyclase